MTEKFDLTYQIFLSIFILSFGKNLQISSDIKNQVMVKLLLDITEHQTYVILRSSITCKQPFKGVLIKKCPEIMQQIFKRTLLKSYFGMGVLL